MISGRDSNERWPRPGNHPIYFWVGLATNRVLRLPIGWDLDYFSADQGVAVFQKPQERRLILEEAAGITGLHSRRKEAEQRLRAAENNLERLDDIMGQMEIQAGSLKRLMSREPLQRQRNGTLRLLAATQPFDQFLSFFHAPLRVRIWRRCGFSG